jgi:hypothetical protein
MSELKTTAEDGGWYSYERKASTKPQSFKERSSIPVPENSDVIGAYLATVRTTISQDPPPAAIAEAKSRENIEQKEDVVAPLPQKLSVQEEEDQIVDLISSTFQKYEDTFEHIVKDLNKQVQSLNLPNFKQHIDLKNFYKSVIPALLPLVRVPDYGMIHQFQDIVKLPRSQRDAKNSELVGHCSNFVELATRYGEIIVAEKHGIGKHSKSVKVRFVSLTFHLN